LFKISKSARTNPRFKDLGPLVASADRSSAIGGNGSKFWHARNRRALVCPHPPVGCERLEATKEMSKSRDVRISCLKSANPYGGGVVIGEFRNPTRGASSTVGEIGNRV